MQAMARTFQEVGDIMERHELSPEAVWLALLACLILLTMMNWEERRQERSSDIDE